MAEEDPAVDGIAALREAKLAQRDPVAETMRANLRRQVLGTAVEAPRIGRFTILHLVGAGAMGTVLAAYDPVLDRRVALKRLRHAPGADALSEARVLARLQHPNVVTVYEADVHDGVVHIAMQFVDGVDLGRWLAQRERTPTEIVKVFVDAARGLSAAHAAGVVHGDFKPENVLVDDSGAKVADFGLARIADAEPRGPAQPGRGGTPMYMAPERLRGEPATPASDQFAFGVALWQALVGERPFAGTTIEALTEAMSRAAVVPEGRVVPKWLLPVLRRCLAVGPQDRFASLDEVARALERPRARGRAWFLLVGLASVAAVWWIGRSDDPCAGGDVTAQGLWSPEQADDVRSAFVRTEAPFATDAADRVDAALLAYRDGWADAHRRICEAARVRGDLSDSGHDGRMACLEDRRAQAEAFTTALLEVPTGRSVAEAVATLSELPDPAPCVDGEITEIDVGNTSLDPELDRGWALYRTARYPEAHEIARDVATRSEGLDAAAQARAQFLLGTVQGRIARPEDAEVTLRAALVAAAQAEQDPLAAQVALQLLRTVMFSGDDARVLDLADLVRATVASAGLDTHEVDGIVGEARLSAGDAEGAIADVERALAVETRPDRIAILESTHASAELARDRPQRALVLYQRALDIAVRHFGPAHPVVGFHLQRFGRGLRAAGQLEEAFDTLTRALALREAALGPEDRAVASALTDLAAVELELQRPAAAREHLQRALTIRVNAYGADHGTVAEIELALGDAARAEEDVDAALAHYRRARSIRARAHPDHPGLPELDRRIAELQDEL